MADFQGKRIEDGEFPTNPGEYSKHSMGLSLPNNVVEQHIAWLMIAPTGGSVFFIGRPNADGSAFHWVQENEDGTITVRPNPPDAPPERRNSNSILAPIFKGHQWHGYIRHGVWVEC